MQEAQHGGIGDPGLRRGPVAWSRHPLGAQAAANFFKFHYILIKMSARLHFQQLFYLSQYCPEKHRMTDVMKVQEIKSVKNNSSLKKREKVRLEEQVY